MYISHFDLALLPISSKFTDTISMSWRFERTENKYTLIRLLLTSLLCRCETFLKIHKNIRTDMDIEFGEVWIFLGIFEFKSVIFLLNLEIFLINSRIVRNRKVEGAEWRVPKFQSKAVDVRQLERTRTALKILASESDSLVLYVIGWLDFDEIISQWSDDILKQIIENHERLQERSKEENKFPPSTIFDSCRKDHSAEFETSELYDNNLKGCE